MEQLRKHNDFVFLKFMRVRLHVQQPIHAWQINIQTVLSYRSESKRCQIL